MRTNLGSARARGNAAQMLLARATAIAIGLTASYSPAVAQPQTPAQEKCIVAFTKATSRVVRTQAKEISSCLNLLAEEAYHHVHVACLTYDPKGKVARVSEKLADVPSRKCADTPDFGLSDAATATTSELAETIAALQQLYGKFRLVPGIASPRCAKELHKLISKILA